MNSVKHVLNLQQQPKENTIFRNKHFKQCTQTLTLNYNIPGQLIDAMFAYMIITRDDEFTHWNVVLKQWKYILL